MEKKEKLANELEGRGVEEIIQSEEEREKRFKKNPTVFQGLVGQYLKA